MPLRLATPQEQAYLTKTVNRIERVRADVHQLENNLLQLGKLDPRSADALRVIALDAQFDSLRMNTLQGPIASQNPFFVTGVYRVPLTVPAGVGYQQLAQEISAIDVTFRALQNRLTNELLRATRPRHQPRPTRQTGGHGGPNAEPGGTTSNEVSPNPTTRPNPAPVNGNVRTSPQNQFGGVAGKQGGSLDGRGELGSGLGLGSGPGFGQQGYGPAMGGFGQGLFGHQGGHGTGGGPGTGPGYSGGSHGGGAGSGPGSGNGSGSDPIGGFGGAGNFGSGSSTQPDPQMPGGSGAVGSGVGPSNQGVDKLGSGSAPDVITGASPTEPGDKGGGGGGGGGGGEQGDDISQHAAGGDAPGTAGPPPPDPPPGQNDDGKPPDADTIGEWNQIAQQMGQPPVHDPNPDDPDGSSESPTIPGRGFHPHGGNTRNGAAPPSLPDPGDVATSGPFAGWTSGDGGDWGGNPHENPDPDDSGGASNINSVAVAQNNANPDDLSVPNVAGDAGGNQDDFWAGNNPHYMPYQGAAWTPVASVSRVTKASTVSRTIVRAGTVHFR